jgi:hypothetical protein
MRKSDPGHAFRGWFNPRQTKGGPKRRSRRVDELVLTSRLAACGLATWPKDALWFLVRFRARTSAKGLARVGAGDAQRSAPCDRRRGTRRAMPRCTLGTARTFAQTQARTASPQILSRGHREPHAHTDQVANRRDHRSMAIDIDTVGHTYDELKPASAMLRRITNGWPRVLSSFKSSWRRAAR